MACPKCNGPAVPSPTPEEKPLMPTSVYAVSKRDQEELCLCVGRSYGIPTVALRYFNVYGPRQALSNPYTGVCAIFSAQIKNTHQPLVFEDGGQTRDFIHVRDIVQANLLAMEKAEADYEMFNVGTEQPTSVAQIAQLLAKLYRIDVKPNISLKYRAGDIRHCTAAASKLRALGFKPGYTLEQGLRELVEWGRQVEAKDRVQAAALELETRGLTRG
jgi:dTDP-L-rhamnose 4-epimerase